MLVEHMEVGYTYYIQNHTMCVCIAHIIPHTVCQRMWCNTHPTPPQHNTYNTTHTTYIQQHTTQQIHSTCTTQHMKGTEHNIAHVTYKQCTHNTVHIQHTVYTHTHRANSLWSRLHRLFLGLVVLFQYLLLLPSHTGNTNVLLG